MAGYNGYSKSNNAISAEEDGRFPMSAAAKIVSEATGLKRTEAKVLLEKLHGGEYHHTSKMYNRTKYYDTAEAIRHHELSVFAAALPADWREAMTAVRKRDPNEARSFSEREADIDAADTFHAQSLGVSVNDLTDAYYYLFFHDVPTSLESGAASAPSVIASESEAIQNGSVAPLDCRAPFRRSQ